MNTFGRILRLTTFGESHGTAIGGVLDGYPAGILIDEDFVREQMRRRRPGQSRVTTARNEADEVEFLSGIFEGRTTGTPIGFIIRNTNNHSADYDNLRDAYRPSHADYTYAVKYGVRDHRGGGRSSARETAVRVCAGALAKLALKQLGITVQAYTSQVGSIALAPDYHRYDLSLTESNAVRCPDPVKAAEMEELIASVKAEGDTIVIQGVKQLRGGVALPNYNDHRMVMLAAIAAADAQQPVTVAGTNALSKSWPEFLNVYRMLGGKAE